MLNQIDPLSDRRWDAFIGRHPNASIFHTSGWLEALRRTYGYEPVVYTTSSPHEEMTNGIVFCCVSSWLTGKRLVSLPFSDHCDPLLEDGSRSAHLFEGLRKEQADKNWKYIEMRPRSRVLELQANLRPVKSYSFHALDLRNDEKALFSGFHKDCVQRKIRRAERQGLAYREGCQSELLKMFYQLFVRMRQRRRLPPQPFHWFQNLSECLGPAMQVRVASYGGRLAASILTLRFRDTLVYKYGCSDPQLNNLGGIQWLFWKAIREAKALGMRELDLGRSDWDNPGLITFKDRLGAKRFSIHYWQYAKAVPHPYPMGIFSRPAGWVLGHIPTSALVFAGRILYRHIG